MNLHFNAHPAPGLGAEASTNPRAGGSTGSPGAFAGVLGAQVERNSGGAYHGSAFDVPEARREPASRPAPAA
ncbi:hypothetical protein, partial [Methylibium sp.]|uniref:hypothetical protein n=1 Tax=Methylibium sp. TaxID=2067992 RepID=UPI0017EF575C